MVSKLKKGLLLIALFWMNSAFATLITFDHLINNPSANREVAGTEWISQGLRLASPTLGLNVGCGIPVSCLGADKTSVADFNGIIDGSFTVPGTVFSLGIQFCCEDFERPPGFDDKTITSIFDTSGMLLAQIFDTDFLFRSRVPIGSFSVDLGSDALLGLRFNEVAEPASFGLLLLSLCALLLFKRRRWA